MSGLLSYKENLKLKAKIEQLETTMHAAMSSGKQLREVIFHTFRDYKKNYLWEILCYVCDLMVLYSSGKFGAQGSLGKEKWDWSKQGHGNVFRKTVKPGKSPFTLSMTATKKNNFVENLSHISCRKIWNSVRPWEISKDSLKHSETHKSNWER